MVGGFAQEPAAVSPLVDVPSFCRVREGCKCLAAGRVFCGCAQTGPQRGPTVVRENVAPVKKTNTG